MRAVIQAALALYLWLGLWAGAWGQTAPKPVPIRLYPVLGRDDRLTRPITVKAAQRTVGEVLEIVHDKTGVELVAVGEVVKKPCTVLLTNRTARQVLTDLALGVGGDWIRRGGRFILVNDPNLQNVLRAQPSIPEVNAGMVQLVRSLTNEQRTALKTKGRLSFEGLTEQQRRWFLMSLFVEYQNDPNGHPESILTGKGAELRWGRESVIFCAPRKLPDGKIFSSRYLEIPA
jgi:hypothetical protein